VQHGKVYANIGRDDDILSIGANRAIDLIVQKESGGGGSRFGRAADPGRSLGDHPDGGAVTVKAGRFGPYVSWGKVNATIPRAVDPATLTLPQALELIAARAAGGGGAATAGRALGEHPDGGTITVRAGRYGPYVNLGKINATLPKSMSADDVTLEDAIALINEKGGPPKKKAAAKKAPAKAKKVIADSDDAPFDDAKPVKKAAAKKPAMRKTATKKAPAKKTAARKVATKT
jgi:DNA topoisomerase-1